MNVLTKIINQRELRINEEGFSQGLELPPKRALPLTPFGRAPFAIAEIKRSSPSKGEIAKIVDPVEQARKYVEAGVKSVSVLTEQDNFTGSLEDLIAVKTAFPDLAVLRKDFLLSVKDVEVSYLVGADAILLMASVLDKETFEAMYKKCKELGMAALVEVHDEDEVNKVKDMKPQFTGINSRDLRDFTTDAVEAIKTREYIKYETKVVFESGIKCADNVRIALANGFDAILVGETFVKHPEIIEECLAEFDMALKRPFWAKLSKKRETGKPLVKICGITNLDDAKLSVSMGADLLGFIMTDSKRYVDRDTVEEIIAELPGDVIKVAVVNVESNLSDFEDAMELYFLGYIDVLQFHGDESSEFVNSLAVDYYKVIKPELEQLDRALYSCPRVLYDSASIDGKGGTGERLQAESIVDSNKEANGKLWIAGGVSGDNYAEVIKDFNPELIDVCSMVEFSPGIKSKEKLEKLFEARNM